MRDSVTADDLAVQAAKQKLAELVDRQDYKVAMARVKKPEKGPKVFSAICSTTTGAGAIALGWAASGLAWIGVIGLGAMSLLTGIAWLGLANEKPPTPHGVAIVGKHINDNGVHFVQLLKTDGNRVDGLVTQNEYNLLKAGDIGVAWIRDEPHVSVLVELERL